MEADGWTVIGITRPASADIVYESRRITELLDTGVVDRMHLRKDHPDEVFALLDAIPARLHGRLSLHRVEVPADCAAQRHAPDAGAPSCSCHSLNELEREVNVRDYVFLSPVFDSISKPGYRAAAFDTGRLRDILDAPRRARVIALGGVTPGHFDELRRLGFDGAAMLGFLWRDAADERHIITSHNLHP